MEPRKIKGVVYDTGMDAALGDKMKPLDLQECQREMQIIRDDLHCNAVRVLGSNFESLEIASEECLKLGMEAWIAPYLIDRTREQTLELLIECAKMAQRLQEKYPDGKVVYVAGGEFLFYMKGILEGENFIDRTATYTKAYSDPNEYSKLLKNVEEKMAVIMPEIVTEVRKVFHGEITYATMPFDPVDWSLFDFISLDYYRGSYNRETYGPDLRPFIASDIPVIIMEVGLCTFQGAEDMGAGGHMIIDNGWGISGDYVRDESLQAKELVEMMEICEKEGVQGQFVFYFKEEAMTYNEDPHKDLDMACYGLVKCYADKNGTVYPDMKWDPKESFYAVAKFYEK